MTECCENPQKHHAAIFEKYSDKRFKRAATFVQNEMQRGFRVPEVSATRSSVNSTVYTDPYDGRLLPPCI